jgi:hypothetical protein
VFGRLPTGHKCGLHRTSTHRHLRQALEQALRLKGTWDFSSLEQCDCVCKVWPTHGPKEALRRVPLSHTLLYGSMIVFFAFIWAELKEYVNPS